jgi:HlyD family secretion protein
MFKFLLKSAVVLGVLTAIGYFAYGPIAKSIANRNKPRWRTAAVEQGPVTAIVNATGTIKPVMSIAIGSFVSGPIKDLYVKFNQEVTKGELLARIDPRLISANVDRDKAVLETRKAEVMRVKALLQQAVNDEQRAGNVNKRNKDFIAQAELDQVKFNRMSLEAQLVIAEANILQADASLKNSQANLDYTEIRAPDDGMIIDKKVDLGQTLAAQFQTPELFVVGVGMREKMHVFANVDESEIGLIRAAADDKLPVTFTVDAYPDDLFEGFIEEVRYSSTTTQNVVTYPVVVGASNPKLKLLPGMTANLSFQVNHVADTIRIPKAALRFYPPDVKYVHPDDRSILEGGSLIEEASSPDEQEAIGDQPAGERVKSSIKGRTRHVWFIEGEFLRAIEVQVGISDHRFTELRSGKIDKQAELVTGLKAVGEK